MVDVPPPQSVSDRLHGEHLKSWFCLFHWATPNALSLQSPGLATVHVSFSLKSSPLKSQVASSTGQPDKRTLWVALGRAGRHHPSCWLRQAEVLPGVLRLLYTWEFSCSVGHKDQSGNVALTHLSLVNESSNPGLFSQRHLESSPFHSQYGHFHDIDSS